MKQIANPRPSSAAQLQHQLDFFNRMHPVGTTVTVRGRDGEIVTTTITGPAALLGGVRADRLARRLSGGRAYRARLEGA